LNVLTHRCAVRSDGKSLDRPSLRTAGNRYNNDPCGKCRADRLLQLPSSDVLAWDTRSDGDQSACPNHFVDTAVCDTSADGDQSACPNLYFDTLACDTSSNDDQRADAAQSRLVL
jgi:hypothetical protein